ncbi:MAG TPA: hypothetical protein VMG10_31010 [Gemmataceae bacterium]|nr:hypothetical protein [Gemmataceae bacterium]
MESDVLAFIPDDGYTESGTIIGMPGLYPTVNFSWRPMLQEQLVAYYKAVEKASTWQTRQIVAKLLAEHIVSWDIKDKKEQVMEIKTARCLRIKDKLFTRLFGIVSGQEAPDVQSGQTDDEIEAAASDLLKAATVDLPVAVVREEREVKN